MPTDRTSDLEAEDDRRDEFDIRISRRERAVREPRRERTFVWLCLSTSASITLGLMSIVPAILSLTMFNAPPPPLVMTVIVCVASLSVVALVSILLSWLFYAVQAYPLAKFVSLLPLVNIMVGAIAVVCMYVS